MQKEPFNCDKLAMLKDCSKVCRKRPVKLLYDRLILLGREDWYALR
jgi:hypothetical protein